MGKLSRTKGHSFEREVAKRFREVGYHKAIRKLEYQVTDDLGIDLDGTSPYLIQCKRLKKYSSITAIEEVPQKDGHIPVLITKADNKPAMAVIPFDHFLELVKVEEEEKKQ